MKKRIIAGLLVLASIACLLVGCGGEQSDGTVTNVSEEDFFLYKNGEVVDDTLPSEDFDLEDLGDSVEYIIAGGSETCYKKTSISNETMIAEGSRVYDYQTSKGIHLGSTVEELKEAYKDFPGIKLNGQEWMKYPDSEITEEEFEKISFEDFCENYNQYIPSGREVSIGASFVNLDDNWGVYEEAVLDDWAKVIGNEYLIKEHSLSFYIENGVVTYISIDSIYLKVAAEE